MLFLFIWFLVHTNPSAEYKRMGTRPLLIRRELLPWTRNRNVHLHSMMFRLGAWIPIPAPAALSIVTNRPLDPITWIQSAANQTPTLLAVERLPPSTAGLRNHGMSSVLARPSPSRARRKTKASFGTNSVAFGMFVRLCTVSSPHEHPAETSLSACTHSHTPVELRNLFIIFVVFLLCACVFFCLESWIRGRGCETGSDDLHAE